MVGYLLRFQQVPPSLSPTWPLTPLCSWPGPPCSDTGSWQTPWSAGPAHCCGDPQNLPFSRAVCQFDSWCRHEPAEWFRFVFLFAVIVGVVVVVGLPEVAEWSQRWIAFGRASSSNTTRARQQQSGARMACWVEHERPSADSRSTIALVGQLPDFEPIRGGRGVVFVVTFHGYCRE